VPGWALAISWHRGCASRFDWRVGSVWLAMETIASPEMVAVPAGQVTLSDRRTRRSWHVDVASFEIAINLLTQGEYADITGERPGATRGDRLPIESVSWWDAIQFCNRLVRAGWPCVRHLSLSAARHVAGNARLSWSGAPVGL
jgi:formylglycine-generating enzyme required for sulfatase activity